MGLKRVYLDQRDWIALARQHYGKAHNGAVADVLAIVREASEAGHASFPLSAAHYMELYKISNPDRRRRLGSFMAEISRFHSIASAPDLLEAEVHVSVCAIAGVRPVRHPIPFGRGARHAFGAPTLTYFPDPDTEQRAVAHIGADRVFEYFETALLAGPDQRLSADGVEPPTLDFGERQLDFELDTARKLQEWGHSREHAHRLVLAQEAQDIEVLVDEASAAVGLDSDLIFGSYSSLTSFIMSLPAKGTICRMRMCGHENPSFRWQRGDLYDVNALGSAATYCDVLVAERHWSSILNRAASDTPAVVTSELQDLPQLLIN